MAQRYITSGRRYKEPQGLAPIINPYYAKRALQAKEPTLDNIAVGKAATLDAISDYTGDGGDALGFNDAGYDPSITQARADSAITNAMGFDAKGMLADASKLGLNAMMSPLATAIPFGIRAADVIGRGINARQLGNQLGNVLGEAEDISEPALDAVLGRGTSISDDLAIIGAETTGAGRNTVSRVGSIMRDAERSKKDPLYSLVDRNIINPVTKVVRDSFGGNKDNSLDESFAAFQEASVNAPFGMHGLGLLGVGPVSQTDISKTESMQQSMDDAQQNSLNQDSAGDVGDATPSGMGAAVGDMW